MSVDLLSDGFKEKVRYVSCFSPLFRPLCCVYILILTLTASHKPTLMVTASWVSLSPSLPALCVSNLCCHVSSHWSACRTLFANIYLMQGFVNWNPVISVNFRIKIQLSVSSRHLYSVCTCTCIHIWTCACVFLCWVSMKSYRIMCVAS